jgi:hypothetical protein
MLARMRRLPGGYAAVALAGAVMLVGVLLRLPISTYTGRPSQNAFNSFVFLHPWAYSDIASLYFRDHLSHHPLPYFDYRLEYPVLGGGLIWLIGFVHATVWSYLLASAAVLVACGLVLVRLIGRVPGSNPWLLALSPALALYVVLNWDLFGLALTVGAIVLFLRGRVTWAAIVLGLAVWAKFFPVLLLPLLLVVLTRQRRWREAALGAAAFAAVSLAVNLPVAFQPGPNGLVVRRGWAWFFEYNQSRPREVNLWNLFDSLGLKTSDVNLYSGVLLVLGVAAILLVFSRSLGRSWHGALLAPAVAALLAWFFFVNKVYSPQYSLWIMAALALGGAPVALGVAFAALDVTYYAASFAAVQLGDKWFFDHFLMPSAMAREAGLLAVAAWGIARLVRAREADPALTPGAVAPVAAPT